LHIEEDRADFDRLGGPLLWQARGLEVDDRDRSDYCEPRRERRQVEVDVEVSA
jgi:hypothetical protein